jgi:predicted small metal-binding protein
MAFELNCADTGAACPFSVTAETKDEVMQHVANHAAIAHPDLELNAETVEQIKGLVRPV